MAFVAAHFIAGKPEADTMSDSALRPDVSLIGELSPADKLRRAARMAYSSPKIANKTPACVTDVWFSVFFDGTGNSLYDEEPRPADQQGYSNVARLFPRICQRRSVLTWSTNFGQADSRSPPAQGVICAAIGKNNLNFSCERQFVLRLPCRCSSR
jgi:hypothetical protein